MNNFLVKSQISPPFILESLSYKGWVWLQQADWEVEDEQQYFTLFNAQRSLRFSPSIKMRVENRRILPYKAPQRPAQFLHNVWLLKDLASSSVLGCAEIDCQTGDFVDARLHFELAEPSQEIIELIRHLISACFIAFRIDQLRVIDSDGVALRRLTNEENGAVKRVLVGSPLGRFNVVRMHYFDRINWWQSEYTQQDFAELSYLRRRVMRYSDQQAVEKVQQFPRAKKKGLLARLFGGWKLGSNGHEWSRWSKRN